MLGVKVLLWDPKLPFPTSPILGVAWRSASVWAKCECGSPSRRTDPQHNAPSEDCNCGVHALSAMWMLQYYIYSVVPESVRRNPQHLFVVLVEASGKVILHETGWRAEAADIIGVCSFPQELPDRTTFHLTYKAASYFNVPILNFSDVSNVLLWSYRNCHKSLKAEEGLDRLF